MGLFDMFKKKKEEKPEVVDNNGQVQVQPEGVQILSDNTVPPVAPAPVDPTVPQVDPTQAVPPVPTDVSADFSNPEVTVTDTVTEVVAAAVDGTSTIDNSGVPASIVPVEESTESMNQVVDNANPSEVQQVAMENEKSASQDIVPAMEDVAALIDNPIPAKSEEESMYANPEEIIEGGDTQVEWQENPFKDDNTFQNMPTDQTLTLEAAVNEQPVEDSGNLVDNLVSADENIVSNNEPMEVQSFEPSTKEDQVQDLSDTLKMEALKEEQSAVQEENVEDVVETIPEEDTVIKVDENEATVEEESNIFKNVDYSSVSPEEFIPIVVDEHEDDDIENTDPVESNSNNDDPVLLGTTDFTNMISEVTSITDGALANDNYESEEKDDEIEEVKEEEKKEEPKEETKEEVEEEQSDVDDEVVDATSEKIVGEKVDSFEEENEDVKDVLEESSEEVEEKEESEEEKTEEVEEKTKPEEVNEEKDEPEKEESEEIEEVEEEEKEGPVLLEPEESDIFNVDEEEEMTEEAEVKEEEPVVEEEEEEFDGPIIEEESTFTIFDLPAITPEHEEEREKIEEELDKDIFNEKEETNDNIVVADENFEKIDDEDDSDEEEVVEEEGPKKVERVDDIVDMYSQLEFKNEKIRFCDNCGAMILGETATVCPSCGEPL